MNQSCPWAVFNFESRPLEVQVKLYLEPPLLSLYFPFMHWDIWSRRFSFSRIACQYNKNSRSSSLSIHLKIFPFREGGGGSGGNCPHWVFIAPTLPSLWGRGEGEGRSEPQSVPHFISVWNWLSRVSSGEQHSSPGHRDNVQECLPGCCPTDGWAFSWHRDRVTL